MLAKCRSTIDKWWPTHWPVVEAMLAACGTLLLENITQGLALLTVGDSGGGKGTTLEMFQGAERVLWIDKFSPASLLSGYADDVSKDEANDRALFKLVKHQVLMTGDLGPLFRGGDAETRQALYSLIPPWMDGSGLVFAVGTHGMIGTKGDFSFVWMGGTTPLHTSTWRAMATVGPRLLFMRISKLPKDHHIAQEDYVPAKRECQGAVSAYLAWLLNRYPIRSVKWPGFNSKSERERMMRYCELMAFGQASPAGDEEPIRPTPHHLSQRLAILLNGLALIRGAKRIGEAELRLAKRIVQSNAPKKRGRVLLALEEGCQTAAEISARSGLYLAQTYNILKELEHLGILHIIEKGGQGTSGAKYGFAPEPPDLDDD
jgi:hypothetical protein